MAALLLRTVHYTVTQRQQLDRFECVCVCVCVWRARARRCFKLDQSSLIPVTGMTPLILTLKQFLVLDKKSHQIFDGWANSDY